MPSTYLNYKKMAISWLDLSSTMGLIAMIALTLNMVLGILLSTGYKQKEYWKKLPIKLRQLNVLSVHNWAAYIALFLVSVHVLFLLLDKSSKFMFRDILYPINAPHQNIAVTLGVFSFYALVIVIITTQQQIKKRMSFRFWKNIHLISYLTTLLFIIHGILMDPLLKDRPVDWLDGEKLLVEACAILLVASTYLRIRYQLTEKKLTKLNS